MRAMVAIVVPIYVGPHWAAFTVNTGSFAFVAFISCIVRHFKPSTFHMRHSNANVSSKQRALLDNLTFQAILVDTTGRECTPH